MCVNDWREWAIKREIDASIIAFIAHRPDALFTFAQTQERAFATPRTWEYVNQILACAPEEDLLLSMLGGTIGEELAASFLGFRSVADEVPEIEAIFNGTCHDIPSSASALHILCAALSMRINENTSSKKLNNLLEYTLKLPAEFAVMIVQDLRERHIELDHLQNWSLWMKKYNTLLR